MWSLIKKKIDLYLFMISKLSTSTHKGTCVYMFDNISAFLWFFKVGVWGASVCVSTSSLLPFLLSFLKRTSCQAQREHVSIKVRLIWGVSAEACSRYGRVGLTHTEAQESACHCEHSTLPQCINTHWLYGETSNTICDGIKWWAGKILVCSK